MTTIEIRRDGDNLVCDLGEVESCRQPEEPHNLTTFDKDYTDRARVEKQFWRGSECIITDNIATLSGEGWQYKYELFPARWWDSPPDTVDVYLAQMVKGYRHN